MTSTQQNFEALDARSNLREHLLARHRPNHLRRIITCAATWLSAACGSTSDAPYERRTASVIEGIGPPQSIIVPDTVDRSIAFLIGFPTFGGGCHREGSTETVVEGRLAILRPYDIELVTNQECPAIQRIFSHYAAIRFDSAGSSVIRIEGRSQNGERRTRDVPVWVR
jgi:hypothetical protein